MKTADLHSNAANSREHLLRLLIGQLPPPSPARPQSASLLAGEADEIVLDVEFDGYRYFLVRTLKPSRAPIELSPREKEIVRMVAQGHPNKIIAAVLNISSWTVCTHLRRVFAKLGVGSRAAMVARLHEMGTIRSGVPRSDAGNVNCNPISETNRSNPNTALELSSKREKLTPSRRQTA